MARARNIKPGFFANEDLAECTPWARLCFIGLWLLADREGRLEDRPKRIKGELFRFDSIEVDPLLGELEARGFVVRYRNSDGSFIQVCKFSEHQTPHYSEKPSAIKPPSLQECATLEEAEFREASRNQPGMKPGEALELSKSSPGVEASSRGGHNPLNPDSLNPDSGILNASPPEKEARKRGAAPPDQPPDVAMQVWSDWLALRKAKKAPVTQTVVDNATAEAAKAGMTLEAFLRVWCARGSQGLQAEWLKPNERPQRVNGHDPEPEWRREQRERNEAFLGPYAAKRNRPETVDMEAPDAAPRLVG